MTLDLTQYRTNAKPIVARFDDQMMTMLPKVYSTGSVGWYANGKARILVDDVYYPVQVSLTMTIIGSKNLHAQEGTPEPQEGQYPALLGPEYPWNESGQDGAILKEHEASGIETASHNGEQKMRKRPRKAKK